jgi:hypothetical protein
MIVHRTLNDVSRRMKNVIITGLPEESDTGVEDRTTFEEFAAAYLPIKPALAAGRCCQRIGKPSQDRPRRLLVRLNSEQAAADLVKNAPSLRNADDEYIAANVYINPDLSPTAAKLAYQARKRRRENLIHRSTATAGDRPADNSARPAAVSVSVSPAAADCDDCGVQLPVAGACGGNECGSNRQTGQASMPFQ